MYKRLRGNSSKSLANYWRALKKRGKVLKVRDQDAALRFFTEKLGFKVTTEQPMSEKQRWIELMIPGADSGLALFTPEGHESRMGEIQSMPFWCDDVFATIKVMKSKGAQCEV